MLSIAQARMAKTPKSSLYQIEILHITLLTIKKSLNLSDKSDFS